MFHDSSWFAPHRLARVVVAICVVAVLVGAKEALAGSLLFDQISAGGSLDYDGEGGSLVGTDIVFEEITGFDTPVNNGDTLTLVDGRLNFTTGANTGESPPFWTWAGGGSFTITADDVLDPSNTPIISGSDVVILSGSFYVDFGDPVLALESAPSPNVQITVTGFGIDTKHPVILAYFGLSDFPFEFANSNITASGVTDLGNGGFSGDVIEADIVNSQVPEPSGVVLAGLAAACAFVLRRRIVR